MSIYLDLTRQFNEGRVRAIVCSGQAVVLYRLAIMSKDGDWILREDDETMRYVLGVLDGYGARYRFGAPLDTRWLEGGWSAHLHFTHDRLRVRTDFFTRPPRIPPEDLERTWREQAGRDVPVVGLRELAEMKKTNREKDYVIIGELARRLSGVEDQLMFSRSARDILELARDHADLVETLTGRRPLLARVHEGRETLERELDAERRAFIGANERRLARFREASEAWARLWPEVEREASGRPLSEAHRIMVDRATDVLPFALPGERA